MNQISALSGKRVAAVFKRGGYEVVSQNGSHQKLQHPETGGWVIIQQHNCELPPHFIKRLINQAGWTVEEYLKHS